MNLDLQALLRAQPLGHDRALGKVDGNVDRGRQETAELVILFQTRFDELGFVVNLEPSEEELSRSTTFPERTENT